MDASNVFAQERAEQLLKNYRLTPATLGHKISRGMWIPKPYLLYASLKIAQAIERGNSRLIISWPPRHGKSQLATKYTPLWVLENYPKLEVVICSYGADLSTDFGREIRDTIQDNPDLLNVRLRKDSKGVAKFITTENGSITSIGIGGAITGRGANVFLLDDYIKTLKEAESQVYRDYVWNWWRTTARTRIEPGGSIIIIATRWNRDDMIGRLLREQPGKWEHICIPAIAGENDLFGREPGEALFPERYPIEELMNLKAELGSFYFNAIYQQNPQSEEDKKADRAWIQIIDTILNPERHKRVRVWDFAGTKHGGDHTSGVLQSYDKPINCTYIENVIRKQISPGEQEALVRDTALNDGIETTVLIEQEPGASGVQIVDHYKYNVLPEFTVVGKPTVTSKYVRAAPWLASAEAGKVYMLRGAWNETFLSEMDDFPDGANDDQIDCAAIGYNYLTGGRKAAPVWGRTIGSTSKPQDKTPVVGVTWGRKIINVRSRERKNEVSPV